MQLPLTSSRPGRKPLRAVALFALLAAFATSSGAAILPGWSRVEIPATGSYFWRYVPKTLDAAHPAPLVLFLHGSGGTPDLYKNFVAPAAEKAGCVVAMPKSSSDLGWGIGNDAQTVS